MPRLESSGGAAGIIQKLTIFYIVVWSISPPLQIDMIYRLAALGCAGIWAVMSLRRGLFVYKIHIYAVMFAVAVAFIAYMEKGSFDAIMQQIAIYIMVVCFIINVFYEDRWHELSGIVPIILILLIVFNWNTAQVLLEDHTIARLLVRDDATAYQYMRNGIGGYSLIYPQVCISAAILAWIISAFKEHKLCFAIGCIWMYTYVICIMRAGYSIAIFVTVIGAILLLLYKGKNVTGAAILSIIFFAAGLAAIMYIAPVRNYLLETFDGTAVADKINDFVGTSENADEGSIQDRIKAYKGSLSVILHYPFIGSVWYGSGSGHTALLDMFAKYGIWGGPIYTIMLLFVPHCYKRKNTNKKVFRACNATMVAILFVAVLDAINYSFMPMILIMLPLLFEDILKWEGIENENSLGGESDSRGVVEKT